MLISKATKIARAATVTLAVFLFAGLTPFSSSAQVHRLRPLDLSLSITQNGSIAQTHRAFNRLVVTLAEGSFELITLDVGNAPIQVCATTSEAPFLSTRSGELISSLPCFKESVSPAPGFGNLLDGWPLPITNGDRHGLFLKEYSLGLGVSRITRFHGFGGTQAMNDLDELHVTVVIDRNGNGRLDENEFSFFDLRIDHSNGVLAETKHPLDDSSCRELLLSEADRIEGELRRLSTRYANRLGDHFALDQFSGDTTAVQETKGVFTLLARDQFEDLFGQVMAAPKQFRIAAATANPAVCTSETEIRETSEMAIATYRQLWEATLELASTTIRGWKKVYEKLGQ